MVKYYTKEEALHAVTKNGDALFNVSKNLKDDFDVVLAAIKNGGSLANASIRLQNDPTIVIEDFLRRSKTGFLDSYDYPRIIFCAKHNAEITHLLIEKCCDWDELIVELKLHLGDKFVAPIEKYNHMDVGHLRATLHELRLRLFHDCRSIYNKALSLGELERRKKLSKTLRHQFLRWHLTGYDGYRRPFSSIVETFKDEVCRLEKIKQQNTYAAGGSYPERFICSLLNVLAIEYTREQIFLWSKNTMAGTKRYDFYVPSLNTIIEVHGAQHYDGGFEKFGGRTLAEERENDSFKEALAKNNGISNYIVINAISSSFDFIRQSVQENKLFCNTFDIAQINWDDVQTELQQSTQETIELPLLDEELRYFNRLVTLFEDNLCKKDFELPKDTANRIVKNNEITEEAIFTTSHLLPHEVILLSRISYMLPWSKDYWYRHYGTDDPSTYVEKFLDYGLIEPENIANTLATTNLAVLKKFLSDRGLDASGKKKVIIERIISSFSYEEIATVIVPKHYALTELGQREILANQFLFEAEAYGLTVWEANMLYIKHQEFINRKLSKLKAQILSTPTPNPKAIEFYNKEICRLLRGKRDLDQKGIR